MVTEQATGEGAIARTDDLLDRRSSLSNCSPSSVVAESEFDTCAGQLRAETQARDR